MGIDGMAELSYYDRRGYTETTHGWAAGQNERRANAQWYDPDYWKSIHRMADLIDEKIDEFNKDGGLGE